jgi:anaerobic magnesium-protoporphyrin IX monomethyl ester cyclase
MTKILLTTLNAKYIHANLAIRLLYQLNKDNKGLHWKEFTIKHEPTELADYCKDYNVIAFSVYIWNITQTIAAAEAIKAVNPNIKILLGGPEVSYEWQDVIALDCIDFIITGEGEIPFQQFISQYPNVEQVPNLVFKDAHGGICYHKSEVQFDVAELLDIDPYIDDPLEDLHNKVLYIETSRGCPYKCEFCLASLDNKVRYLPNAAIKRTLMYMMQHGRVVKFLDRTFNIKKDFTIDIFDFILQHHNPQNVFQFEITADILHADIIKYIHEKVPKNLFRFEIGIQTVNQTANLEVSRKQNFEKTTSIIRQVENHVELHLDLIVGLPKDYYEDIKYSIEEVFKLYAPELQLGFLKFLKGTPVRERYEQYGYEFDPIAPYQIIKSNYLSAEQLEDITLLEHSLEIYWNKKRSVQTCKYITQHYSIFDFLMGLGIHFKQLSNLHKYSLEDVYTILWGYAKMTYPNDEILLQMIAWDYYMHHKVRPKEMFIVPYDKKETSQTLLQKGVWDIKKRFVVMDTSFDILSWINENQIVKQKDQLIIAYCGIDWPIIANNTASSQLVG